MQNIKMLFILVVLISLILGCHHKREIVKNEETDFEKARVSDTINVWQDFIRSYPNGKYSISANDRLNELEAKKDEDFKAQETKAWYDAKNLNTFQSYWDYLDKYRNGKYINESKLELDNLRIDFISKYTNGESFILKSSDYFPIKSFSRIELLNLVTNSNRRGVRIEKRGQIDEITFYNLNNYDSSNKSKELTLIKNFPFHYLEF